MAVCFGDEAAAVALDPVGSINPAGSGGGLGGWVAVRGRLSLEVGVAAKGA